MFLTLIQKKPLMFLTIKRLLRASIHDPAQPGRDGYFIPTSLPWIEILKSLHEKIYPTHL